MHWRNSDFQIAHFIAGRCYTPDEAYRVLKELREERDSAIKNYEVSKIRTEAKRIRARNMIDSPSDEASMLEAKADIAEIESSSDTLEDMYAAACRERDFIDHMISMVQPHRKYAHLDDLDAHQAAQREEWRLKLIDRARTFLLSMQTIPSDHLEIMRAHPDFATSIFPEIESMREKIKSGIGLSAVSSPATISNLLAGEKWLNERQAISMD